MCLVSSASCLYRKIGQVRVFGLSKRNVFCRQGEVAFLFGEVFDLPREKYEVHLPFQFRSGRGHGQQTELGGVVNGRGR